MAQVVVRSLDTPDETRKFENGVTDVVRAGTTQISRARLEPGWKWSNDVKPIAGTDSCQVLHQGYCSSGHLQVRMDDGTTVDLRPGDAYHIEPGHDAWVVGDEAFVGVDFSQQMAEEYAKG
jgi:hypothetical protein